MSTFERVKKLSQTRGISLKSLSYELGFGESTIYKWKTQSPKGEYLEKVADYFNVSVDYLLCRTDSQNTDTQQLLAKQVMMRMNTDGLTSEDINEIEKEMERFFAWRVEEIRKEHEKK